MQAIFENIFTYLSNQLLISLLIFLGVVFIFIRLYEIFISRILTEKFKFFQDRNKEIPLELFLAGVILLGLCLLIKIKYAIPFIWLLCSLSLLIGGALGIIPFSFIEKKKSKRVGKDQHLVPPSDN